MKFAVIDPIKKTSIVIDEPDIRGALHDAGIRPGSVDHGSVSPGIGIAVYEYGLYERGLGYFGLAGRLYVGGAVLYGYEVGSGETVDLVEVPAVEWFKDEAAVEAAIAAGKIKRPTIAHDGVVHWQWPQPKPDLRAIVDSHVKGDAEILKRGGRIVIDGDTTIIGV